MKDKKIHWLRGQLESPQVPIPLVGAGLGWRDRLGGWLARWSVGRMSYSVTPGLYGLGKPTADSPVFASANYKLSFDTLRRNLPGMDAWILVLDTKSINVWCAAGKGTFGSEELIRQIRATRLAERVHLRRVIVPQLGVPGVAAPLVAKETGFKVVFGPVRAADIRAFMANGLRADPAMREVRFRLADRLRVVPVELVESWRLGVPILAVLALSRLLLTGRLNAAKLLANFLPYLGAIVLGTVLFPILLPWIPGRSLAWKGWLLGALATLLLAAFSRFYLPYFLLLPATSAFLALNFTGSTAYTSLSGVKKEMRYGLPLIILSAAAGLIVSFL